MLTTGGVYSYETSIFSHALFLLAAILKQLGNFIPFVFVCFGNMDKKTLKQLSERHQSRLKKELEALILSVG